VDLDPVVVRGICRGGCGATFGSFLSDLLPGKHLSLVPWTTAGGRKALGIRGRVRQGGLRLVETVYAPASGAPLPFYERAVVTGKPGVSVARMSRWNEPVQVKAPAHSVPIATVLAH
jgi:hypothetical protein